MSPSPTSLVLLAVVLLAGAVGGTAVYRAVVPASGAEPSPRQTLVVDSAGSGADQQAARDQRRPRFAPCVRPARLEDGTCVTEEVRTVTIPAQGPGVAAPPPAPAPAAPAAPAAGGSSSHHHDGDDDDHHGHHGGDDHGDDDHSGHGHGGDDDDHDDDDHDDDDDHSGHGHGGDDDHDDDDHDDDHGDD